MNRLLEGEPLDCRVLGPEARARNPFPAEAALLAHCVMVPSRVEQLETVDVTPPCATLLDIIEEFGALVRGCGLAAVTLQVYSSVISRYEGLDRKPILEHIDVYDLATLVDSIRVVELAAIGDFELVVSMMRGRLAPRKKRGNPAKPAHERAISEALGS